jgi:iron-sulfur cluster assembly accessory protein
MLTITDLAVEKAKEILTAEGKADWGIRVFAAGGGCCGPSYGMDLEEKPGEGDEIIEKDGLKLFLDRSSFDNLKGFEIDFIDDGQQQGFVMKGGPSGGSCGSGGCSTC